MNSNTNEVKEIDIKDLLVFWLLHFRSALIICIACALVLGGYKGFTSYRSNKINLQAKSVAEAEGKEFTTVSTKSFEIILSNEENADISQFEKNQIIIKGDDNAWNKQIATAVLTVLEDKGFNNVVFEVILEEEHDATKMVSPVKTALKYGFIAIVISLFMHGLYYIVFYLTTSKYITCFHNITEHNIRTLVSLRDADIKLYKNKGFIDKILRKIGMYQKEMPLAELNNLLISDIKVLNHNNGKCNLLIAGQADIDIKNSIARALRNAFSDVSIEVADSIINNPCDREKIIINKNVIFIQQYGITQKQATAKEIEIVNYSNGNIIGNVWC